MNTLHENGNRQIVYAFVQAINEHDTQKIYSLMTDDHRFIDAHGNEMTGKETMNAGWAGYFQMFPDYTIQIKDLLEQEDLLGAFGFASGTYKINPDGSDKNFWLLPASWKIIIRDGKIKLWQVFADTKIPFDIINNTK